MSARGVHARVLGAGAPGRPAVLVRGVGVSGRSMLPLARRLARLRPVYAPDLPGFGRTPGPPVSSPAELGEALGAWMDAVGLAGALVVRHSLGCQTAVHLALGRPGAVDRLVLLAPTFDARARSVPRQALRWLASLPWERPSLAPVLAHEYLDWGAHRLLGTLRRGLEDPVEDGLPRVRRPLPVVGGARDAEAPPRGTAAVAAALAPGGRLRTIPGRGHALTFSAAEEVADLVEAFAADGDG